MPVIDPTARVASGAVIGDDVAIGPFCVVGPRAVLSAGCRLIAHVHIMGRTTVGARTVIYPFASLGTPPQSTRYRGGDTALEEAARSTGAGTIRVLGRITIPLLRPALVGTWIYIFIVSLRELGSSILLYSSESVVLAVRIFDLRDSGNYTSIAALSIFMIVILVILAAFLWQIARGHTGEPYSWLGAIAGVAYIAGVVFIRVRG